MFTRQVYFILTILSSVSVHGQIVESPKATYTIIAPSKLRPNSDYHISISLHNTPSHVDVDLSLQGQESDSGRFNSISKTILVNSEETRIINLEIGEWASGSYKLIVVGRGGIDFRNETSISYQAKSYSVFIQTDKAIYKPGQLVQFRAIVVNPSLMPSVTGGIDIHINDARGNRIKQWTRVLTTKGVTSHELQLSSEPVLGDWTIVVTVLNQKFEKTFTVAEYILPTFDVEVILPSYATYNESDVICTVKATYTYGKPVKGDVTLTIQPRVRYNWLTVRPIEQFQAKAHMDGSVDFQVNVVRDLDLKTDFFEREIEFFALVEETLTGRKYNRTGILKMYDKKVKVDLIKTSKTFKPGLKNNIVLKVAYQDDTPVEDDGTPLKLRYGYSYNDDLWNETYQAVPSKGIVSFDIIPPKSDITVLGMGAEYRGQDYFIETTEAAQSPSNNFIQLTLPSSETPRVGSDLTVKVLATEPFSNVVYEVMGRGDIVLARSFSLAPTVEHQFTFQITQAMSPKVRIVAYYIRPENQEIVADAINTDVDGVFRTPISLSTSVATSKPGSPVTVNVATKPGAYVGLLALDQSILLLKTGNDITQADVIKELETYDGGKSQEFPSFFSRSKRSLWWPGSVSAGEIFSDSGVIILSNGLIHRNLPMRSGKAWYVPSERDPKSRVISVNDEVLDYRLHRQLFTVAGPRDRLIIRKNYPETWLWDAAITGSDGLAKFSSPAPDTITSWIITAFSMDSVTGLGIVPSSSKVTVFRPFFIQLALPYSVIRGESIAITVVVFNYMDRRLNAEVVIENNNNEFDFAVASDDDHYKPSNNEIHRTDSKRKYITIQPQDGTTVTFLIVPRKLGAIDIKVTATSNEAMDSVLKKLLVKPEGQPQYFNKAVLIDLRETAATTSGVKKNVSIVIPKNAVYASERITLSVIGDLLGPGINNVDDLLQMPYGCGEQNMLNFVPNIVILEYLARANRLTKQIKEKALKHMEVGYQRELTYKRSDGSFSAFGSQDKSGSTWLTAFVVKSFIQARSHIDIDNSVIEGSIAWLMSRQLADGSFDEPGEVHHKAMQGASGVKGSPALSAFVMTAILQDKQMARKNFTNQLARAEQYLIDSLFSSQSAYEIAIITYALHLADSRAVDSAHQKLINFSKKNNDYTFWSVDTKKDNLTDKQSFHFYLPKSSDVEATAYALLTAVLRSDVESSVPIVRWLISQQNEQGGFSSTQDTVIGLQALGAFAGRTSSTTVSVTVKFNYKSEKGELKSRALRIASHNSMVLQRVDLPSDVRDIQIEATGFGSAVAQVSWQYNLAVSAEDPAFFLNPLLGKTSNENFLQLNICTYYKAGNSTNMAVMEVALPSGYTADVDALPSVTRAKEVKRIDTSDGDTNVIIYMDRITRDELCVTVPAHRNYKVANHKPVPVTVYDYYNRIQSARMFYEPILAKSCDICDGDECGESCNSLTTGTGSQDGEEKSKLKTTDTSSASSTNSYTFITVTTCLIVTMTLLPFISNHSN